jgi:outer membrane lipoprotein-sorting protein
MDKTLMYKKLLFLLLFFTAASIHVFAGAFEDVCSGLARHTVSSGQFELTKTIKKFGRGIVSTGNFTIAKNEGMIWNTKSPFPSTLITGADFIVQITADGKASRMGTSGNGIFLQIASIINAVFSADTNELAKAFTIDFSGTEAAWTITLVPKDRTLRSFSEKITLKGGLADDLQLIQQVLIDESSGNTTKYILKNHKFRDTLDADEKALFTIK